MTTPTYIINYDHIGKVLWGNRQMEESLETSISRLETYPYYKIGWDNEAYTYDYLEREAPELLRRLKETLRRYPDRFGICTCTYGQPQAQFINEESNIRQLVLGLKMLKEHFDLELTVYTSSESGWHSQMPQLIVGCGLKSALLRTHFTMYGYPPQAEAPVVTWEGPDGTRLPAIPAYPGSYVSVVQTGSYPFGSNAIDNKVLIDYPRVPYTLDELRRRYGERIQPLVASRIDDARQTEECVRYHTPEAGYAWKLVEEIFACMPAPDYLLRAGPQDFNVRMPWGFCGNWIWNRCRQAEIDVLSVERLNALGLMSGAIEPQQAVANEQTLERAWKKLLVAQHHDVQIVGLEADAKDFLDAAQAHTQAVYQASLAAIQASTGRQDAGLTSVFNPLPWARSDWVAGLGMVRDVAGLGFKAVQPAAAQPEAITFDAQKRILETPYYSAHLRPGGGFSGLIERESQAALWKPGAPSGTFAAVVDGVYLESQGTARVTIEDGRALVVETGRVGSLPYTSTWTFYAGQARIDWQAEFEFHGEKIGQPSSDKLDAFSAFVNDQKLRLRFYPVIDYSRQSIGIRDLPFIVAETWENNIEGNYWTAVSDGLTGMAAFNRGLMGAVREAGDGFSIPLAWNMFHVWDPPEWKPETRLGPHVLRGAYQYALGILPFRGDWQAADLHRQALGYNFALKVVPGWAPQEDAWAPLQVEAEGAILSALYTRAGKLYARFYEYRGESANAAVITSQGAAHLRAVDLRELPLDWQGDRASFSPWQIQTFALD